MVRVRGNDCITVLRLCVSMLMAVHINLHKRIFSLPWGVLRMLGGILLRLANLRERRASVMRVAFDDECVVIMGLDVDVFNSGAWDIAVEVVGMCIFFEVESRDEAVQEAMVTREMSVKFIDIVEDWAEVSVDASAVTQA
jgi:hypothetical protein